MAIAPVGGGPRASTEISGSADGAASVGADGAEVVAGDAIGGAQGVQGASGTQEVAQALEAGRIDAEQARAALIEQAIAAHLPAGTDPALIEELRGELQAALADDPTLQSLLA